MSQSITNDMEWLNEEFLEKILKNYEQNSLIKIDNLTIQPATQKGEHYASEINLVKLKYFNSLSNETKEISLIVKSQIHNEMMVAILEDFNIFQREIQIYKILMTEFEKLLIAVNDLTKFGPRSLYAENGVIVQENLKEKGYGICDVKQGLDYNHCLMTLQKLAKFHACSVMVHKNNPDLYIHHMPANFTEKQNPFHLVYINVMASCIEFIETQPELQKYSTKLKSFSKNLIQSLCQIYTRNSSIQFYVLNHGDIWCNNLMFKQNSNGQLEDLLMVDYQEGYYGSLGIDLNYFMYSSWQKDVYLNHKDELIEIYHQVLKETLQKLGYTGRIPSLEDIKHEIQMKKEHGLITAICLLPILISEHQDLADPINFISDSEQAKINRSLILNNPKYVEYLQIFLKDFVATNIL